MTGGISPVTGLHHGTASTAAIACLDRFRTELLTYGLDAAIVFESVRHDPEFAGAHALAAATHLLTMSPEGVKRAGPYAATASALKGSAPPRERLLVDAVACWAAGETRAAEARLEELVARWPQDLVAARLLQVHQLNRGDFRAMRRMTKALVAANPEVSHVGGMHAFALAETGAVRRAERLAREAADAAFDPWAEHALAHVFAARGEAREALRWLSPRAERWSRCSSFLFTHNWWHLALAYLALGDREAVLQLFDTRVWGVRKAYCQDQVNAVSLLVRLELAGARVGDRWADVAAFLAPRTAEHLNGLLDLHYLLGLARAGRDRELAAMQQSLADKSRRSKDPVWRWIVPTAAAGLVAYASGRWESSVTFLRRSLPHLFRLGGSSVQRALFHDLLRHAERAACQ
ncbi:MAG: hypothetical protein SNJ63_03755 [Sphingomonadaceae bacterium]